MKIYINGIFKKIIFKSDKGFIIGLIKVRETNSEELEAYVNKTITFTGYFHQLDLDDAYIFYGESMNHPKYGFQFQVNSYEKIKPADRDGIIEFLSSDLFPGVGKSIATTITETLGNDALNIILDDENALCKIPKLSNKKAESIREIIKKYEESNTTYVYLTEIGFSIKDAMSIYNFYKKNTMDIIKNNIYEIINNIADLSFTKVDEVALRQGVEVNSKNRIKSCILYVMQSLTYANGDTYLEYQDIVTSVNNYLKIDIDNTSFEEYLYELEEEKQIVKYDEHFYLIDIFKAENYVVDRIISLASKQNKKTDKIDYYLNKLEKSANIKYNIKQKEAIKNALEKNILIITGGPGTGKTTIIKAIVDLYYEMNNYSYEELLEHVALLAPTGRASKRMSEATNLPASTIHRYLKWEKDSNTFAVNEYNQNRHDLIIVDEVSMIDINLLSNLLKGLTQNIKLILVGDYNQLPSVGPGQVLKDLIDSFVIDTIELDTLYRQNEDSYINTLAKEIKDNELSETFIDKRSDYRFIECSSGDIKHNLQVLCKRLIEKNYTYKRVQIMAPMYHGENGIDNLNKELQKIFNPSDNKKNELTYGDVIYRENDKVLQLVNFPDLNVFNGDIGIIKKVELGSKTKSGKDEITIDFEGNLVTYNPKDFNKFKHGFIISIHKSQGSEFELVIIPICNSYKRMLYRKLLYTAVTRAKKKLIIIGEVSAFIYSVNNDSEYIRKTSLLDKITLGLYNKDN